jgi:hypothetical protein
LGSTSIAGGGLAATIGEPVIAIGFPIAMLGATTYMIYETAEAQQALTYSLDLKWLTRFGQESVVWLTGKRYLSEEEQVVWQRQIDEWAQNPEFIKKYHQLVDLLAAGVPLQDIQVRRVA